MAQPSQQQRVLQATVPALYLQYLPPSLRGRARQYFGYVANVLPLAAAGTGTATVAIQNDSDFLLVAVTGSARDPAAPTTRFLAPAITLQINDSGSGRNLWAQPVDWITVVGTAELPCYLPFPYLVEKSGEFTITQQSLSLAGGQAYNTRLTLHGFKIFTFSEDV